MQNQNQSNPLSIEITVVSAEGLKTSSPKPSLFSRRIRPFISISTSPLESDGYKHRHVRVDDLGDPTWGDKFSLPIDSSFFANGYSAVHIHLFTKRLLLGRAQLGSCRIPAQDIWAQPIGSARFLSYRLRAQDGSRTPGIINLAVKLLSFTHVGSIPRSLPTCQTVIGIPVGSYSNASNVSSSFPASYGQR